MLSHIRLVTVVPRYECFRILGLAWWRRATSYVLKDEGTEHLHAIRWGQRLHPDHGR
jgi:hypothetical protein